jgi:hypothetical protein
LPKLVTITVAKLLPGTLTTPPTSAAPINKSLVLVRFAGPLSRSVPVPAAPAAASRGFTVSRPLYSRIRTSGKAADWLNLTVTVLLVETLIFGAK